MSAILLDGKSLRDKKFVEITNKVSKLKKKGINPHLVVIQVGANPASNIYVKHKQKACKTLGIKSTIIIFGKDVTYKELSREINKLNQDDSIHGILVQLPLPKSFGGNPTGTLVLPEKDADGTHPHNQGAFFTQQPFWVPIPCTSNGIMELLKEYKIDPSGKEVVIIGRSNMVGRPSSYLFMQADATVSILHSKTTKETFNSKIRSADIIVLATGKKDLITPDMVKDGVVIIDVGIIRMPNGNLRGDILYKDFMDKASHITPVPGGVGPMTIAMLMDNVVKLAEEKNK